MSKSLSDSARRNRELAARRKRGAVMVTLTLEQPHIARLIARGLLEKQSDADREAIAIAVLAAISAAPMVVATGIPRQEPPAGRYPMWVNGKEVKNELEEAAARAAPPTPEKPAPVSDWQKAAIALEGQVKEAREKREAQELENANFTLRR